MENLSNIEVLLDTLVNGLPSETKNLLQSSSSYKQQSLAFLNNLLNQSDNDASVFLSTTVKPSLGNSGTTTLIEQVAELESSQRTLENKIQKLVYSNLDKALDSNETYKSSLNLFTNDFNECCDFLSTNFTKNDEDTDPMDTKDDKLTSKSQETNSWKDLLKQQQYFHSTATTNSNKPDKNIDSTQSSSIVLRNMDSIMDILELPALANACVRSGHYAECVEIASHVRRLSIRYSDVSIIKKVEYNIQLEIKEMVSGLIRLLNTDIKQSSIMKIITYLKRIGPFQTASANPNGNDTINNELLQKIFLKSRYQFILSELDVLMPLKNSNSIDKYLKRCVEVIREHCFQTIMSFESFFPNETSSNKQTNSLLFSFIKSLILKLCAILREDFNKIEKITKDGLLLQLIYCSQSLGRIGGDFNLVILDELNDIIDKKSWCLILKKQKELIKSLNRNMHDMNVGRHEPVKA